MYIYVYMYIHDIKDICQQQYNQYIGTRENEGLVDQWEQGKSFAMP